MSEQAMAVGGLYETCIGVTNTVAAIRWWERFGFRAGRGGALDAKAAKALYGHESAVTSVRLMHQDSDHGLVRLMQWQTPLNEGLGMSPIRSAGSRWSGQFTRSILEIDNHAQIAAEKGMAVKALPPTYIDLSVVYPHLFPGGDPIPFDDRLVAVREYTLMTPLVRQVFFERFNYESPLLGAFNDHCLFRSTQISHVSLIAHSDDADIFNFYIDALGLWISGHKKTPYRETRAARLVFDLVEGEDHWYTDFDEPASGRTMLDRRSGKIKCFRFPKSSPMVDAHERARPGVLGYSLYTWRVRDIEAAHKRAQAAGATDMTDVLPDEFGRSAFSFRAPDGYVWTFIQA
jgi:catechol 2,3-dioxygenase-like lactoylglutathione lyase family enzyme